MIKKYNTNTPNLGFNRLLLLLVIISRKKDDNK